MKRCIFIVVIFLVCIGQLFAQYIPPREKYWVVGDSMQFEFNSSGLPIVTTNLFQGNMKSGATYYDSITGFYCFGDGKAIYDATQQVMSGCLNIMGQYGQYQCFFIPNYSDPDTLYNIYFTLSGSCKNPFVVTTINTTLNNGLGAIVSFDTLEDEFDCAGPPSNYGCDTVTVAGRFIPHGDGKKWWILGHLQAAVPIYFGPFGNSTLDTWVRWLFDNGTVTGPFFQHIGMYYGGDLRYQPLAVAEAGNKVAIVSPYAKKIELFDFDRCTGLLSNSVVLDSGFVMDSLYLTEVEYGYLDTGYISCAFSASGNYLYVNSFDTLYQYDMLANNIADSRTVIWYDTNDVYNLIIGNMELGPDGRIYVGTSKHDDFNYIIGGLNFNRNQYNTWMGIIDKPDLEGPSCLFKRHALYLDGHRSNANTPMRVNTQLGVWVGSPCDPNVTGVAQENDLKTKLHIFPNPANDKINISWPVQWGYSWALKSLAGSTMISGTQQTGNATISTATLPEGMYFLEVHSAKEMKVEKVIILSEK